MKRLLFLSCFILLFFPVFSVIPTEDEISSFSTRNEHRGWIVEFEQPCVVEEVVGLGEVAGSWQYESSTLDNSKSKGIEGVILDSLADSASEFKGFAGAARAGSLSSSRKKLIQKICTRRDVADCKAIVLNEFSLVFDGVALDISDEQAELVKKMPGVKSVSPNYVVRPALLDATNLVNLTSVSGNGSVIQRNLSYTGKSVKIGVIDFGIDLTHPAFGNCTKEKFFRGECKRLSIGVDGCWPEKALAGIDPNCPKSAAIVDFFDEDMDPFDDRASERVSHGTHVASITAGKPDPNGNGVQDEGELWGVAPDAEIVPIRLGVLKMDPETETIADYLVEAIEKVVDPRGICTSAMQECSLSDRLDVVNMSVGSLSTNGDGPVSLAADRAADAGVVVVSSAGNGEYPNTIEEPAIARKAIAVGATDKSSHLAGFSSKGFSLWSTGALMKPDVIAPGVRICAALSPTTRQAIHSLDEDEEVRLNSGMALCPSDDYIALSGTSMASPIVAGIAALIREKHPDFSAMEVKMVIKNTADDLGLPLSEQGFGLVNAEKALAVEHAPPIAMLEPLEVRGNTIGALGTQVRGLAYGRDFKEYVVEIARAHPLSFSFEDNASFKWTEVKRSSKPSRGVLLEDFKPFNFIEKTSGNYLLRLRVINAAGQESIDFMPIKVDFSMWNPVELECQNTSTEIPRSYWRNWTWRFDQHITCMNRYCDATQFFVFLADRLNGALINAQEALDNAKQSVVWRYIYNGVSKSSKQMTLDLLYPYLVLPGIKRDEYVYYVTEDLKPSFEEDNSVQRNSTEIEQPGCQLNSDYSDFLSKSKYKAFSGQTLNEKDLATLESSVKACYGDKYGLGNLYVSYSIPEKEYYLNLETNHMIDKVRSALVEYTGKAYSKKDFHSPTSPKDYYALQPFVKDWWSDKSSTLMSLDVLVEIQNKLAEQVASGACKEGTGKCTIELFDTELQASYAAWKAYFRFLEKHSFWQFGLLLGNELDQREKDFLGNFERYKKPLYGWYLFGDGQLYLIGDSINEDFVSDFQECYSDYLDNLKVKFGEWSFSGLPSKQHYATGKYTLKPKLDFDFADFDAVKFSNVEFELKLVKELDESTTLNPFLFIPFDGEVGLENGRQGYGASISYDGSKPIYFNAGKSSANSSMFETPEYEVVKSSRGADSENIAKVKFEYSDKFEAVKNGSVLSVLRKPGASDYLVRFSPSTPIQLKLLNSKNAGSETDIRLYYGLYRSLESSYPKAEYGRGNLFNWTDVKGNVFPDSLKEQHDADCSGWNDKFFNAKLAVSSKNMPVSAVSFLPQDTGVVFYCVTGAPGGVRVTLESGVSDDTESINLQQGRYLAGSGKILGASQPDEKNITLGSIMTNTRRERYYCINKTGNKVSLVWNTRNIQSQRESGEHQLTDFCERTDFTTHHWKYLENALQPNLFYVSITNIGLETIKGLRINALYKNGTSDEKEFADLTILPKQTVTLELTVKEQPYEITITLTECPGTKFTDQWQVP